MPQRGPRWLKADCMRVDTEVHPGAAALNKNSLGADGRPRYRAKKCLLLQKSGWYRGAASASSLFMGTRLFILIYGRERPQKG